MPVAPESLGRRFEASDRSPRNVLIIALSAAALLVLSLLAATAVFDVLAARRPMQRMQPLGLLVAPDLQPLARPPKPNLAIDDDHAQMTALRREQTNRLNRYGWVDRRHGFVHLPIGRAMDLLLERGLPEATNAVMPTAGSPAQLIQKIPEQR